MNRFFSLTFVLLLGAFVVPSAVAQVSVGTANKAESFDRSLYGIGFAGGPASGAGVSFRAHFPSKSSIEITTGILKTKSGTFFSAGGEYQYDLVRGSSTRFFFGPGVGYFYNGKGKNNFDAPWRAGLGVGGEFKVQEALHITVEGMFVFFSDGSIIPLPQGGLHYYFY